jgi:hypothetical protein
MPVQVRRRCIDCPSSASVLPSTMAIPPSQQACSHAKLFSESLSAMRVSSQAVPSAGAAWARRSADKSRGLTAGSWTKIHLTPASDLPTASRMRAAPPSDGRAREERCNTGNPRSDEGLRPTVLDPVLKPRYRAPLHATRVLLCRGIRGIQRPDTWVGGMQRARW